MLTMTDKQGKSDAKAGFRIPTEVVESLMRFKPPPVKKTPMYIAALEFYIEAAERFGIDADLRPRVSFPKAKEGPLIEGRKPKQRKVPEAHPNLSETGSRVGPRAKISI